MTQSPCPSSVRSSLPDAVSQIRAVLSVEPVTMNFPSGEWVIVQPFPVRRTASDTATSDFPATSPATSAPSPEQATCVWSAATSCRTPNACCLYQDCGVFASAVRITNSLWFSTSYWYSSPGDRTGRWMLFSLIIRVMNSSYELGYRPSDALNRLTA